MAGTTTSMCTSFKSELLAGGHSFLGIVTPTGTTSTSTAVTAMSSMAGVCVGMLVTGSGVAATTYVAEITSSTALVLSKATSSSVAGTPLTFTGDKFNMALVKLTPTGTYDATSTNYTNLTGNSDEVAAGGGYTTNGKLLVNTSPTTSSTTAYITFADVSWTSATFSTTGCMIYNTSVRLGGTSGTNTTGAGRACSIHDFGGTQTVSTGTFSVLMPVAAAATAILRIA